MANQTLQQEKKTNQKQQARSIPGFGTPYKSKEDAIKAAREIASRNGEVVFHVTIEENPAKSFKKKVTGYAEKINPFSNKPFVRPKVVQQKIDDMKQLLKASPIPKEFLKS